MELEMGESLVFSWLRHEQHCQIVQMNWKVSPEWDTFKDYKELNKLYKKSNNQFKYAPKSVRNVEQLIKQGEVDVIGIELDTDNPGTIKTIHAVDVAFHVDGLHYSGTKEETKRRIMKKCFRTALSIYKVFGRKDADIYFVTPYTKELYRNTYVEATEMVDDFFKKEGFSFSFHFYTNDDFYRAIFIPVERNSTITADVSELFVRSLKLIRLIENGNKNENKKDAYPKEEENSYSLPEDLKIGLTVREAFDHLSGNQLLQEEMIQHLQSAQYAKDTFNLSFPALILNDNEDESQRFDSKGKARYFATPYSFNGREYFLCNHWFAYNKEKFIAWFNQLNK